MIKIVSLMPVKNYSLVEQLGITVECCVCGILSAELSIIPHYYYHRSALQLSTAVKNKVIV